MIANKYQRKMVEGRKEKGLCIECGKPMDNDGIQCNSCRARINKGVREIRKWYQDGGVCPRCRKNEILGDEKNCPECRAKAYSLMMPKREENREYYNEMHKEWSKRTHQEMIEKGICTRCRKRKADKGHKTCSICRAKLRDYRRKKYGKEPRSERAERGVCYFCDEPIKQGYKVCEKHYEMNCEKSRSQKAVEARKRLQEMGIL